MAQSSCLPFTQLPPVLALWVTRCGDVNQDMGPGAMLSDKLQTFSGCPPFSHECALLVWNRIQDTTLHSWSSPKPLHSVRFLRPSLSFLTLTLLKSTGQLFVECLPIWVCPVFSRVSLRLCIFGKNTTEGCCSLLSASHESL